MIPAIYRIITIQYAKKFIGIKETYGQLGFNSPEFQEKMKSVKWLPGQDWCAYFVKLIWTDIYKKDAEKLDKILSGATQQTWNNALNDQTGTVKVIKAGEGKPKVGDIAIWRRRSKPAYGHAGLIINVKPDLFKTVEGNTNEEGSPTGYIITEKERSYLGTSTLELLGFIRKA